MYKIILFFVILQSLNHFPTIDALTGNNFIQVQGGEFPFIVSLQSSRSGDNFCGGALVSNQYVLTASHCLDWQNTSSFRIVFEGLHHQQEFIPSYGVDSWKTYFDWTREQNLPYDYDNFLEIAIVKLTDKVDGVIPVQLNGLPKRQLYGRSAIITGRKNNVVSKAFVNILNDDDCDWNIRMIGVETSVSEDKTLCNAALPIALLDDNDAGYPLILGSARKSLLGIAWQSVPEDGDLRAGLRNNNFSNDLIQRHKVNLHFSVEHYQAFIFSFVPATPGA